MEDKKIMCNKKDSHKHNEIIEETKTKMPDTEILFDLADMFKIFGDTTRIRIIYALFENEMSVCCLAELLNLEQSNVSHQLRILRQNKFVKVRRDGKHNFYSLADEHIRIMLDMGLSHILE